MNYLVLTKQSSKVRYIGLNVIMIDIPANTQHAKPSYQHTTTVILAQTFIHTGVNNN